mgnify:CR=1 FL=1
MNTVIDNLIKTTLLPDDLKDEIAEKIHQSKIQNVLLEIKKKVEPFSARETFDPWIQNETSYYRMNKDFRLFFPLVRFDWF